MAVTYNIKGTSLNSFQIGKNGVTLLQGSSAPSGGIDGDYYFRTTNGQLYTKLSGIWVELVDGVLSKDISGAVDVTLTDAESLNRIIDLTGTITAPIDVEVAAVKRLYFIRRTALGAFTVTVKVAGGAGINLQVGQQATVYSDGVDVFLIGQITKLSYTPGNLLIVGSNQSIDETTGSQTNVNQVAHGFTAGDVIRSNGTDDTYTLAQADTVLNAEVVGWVSSVIDVNNFTYQTIGLYTFLTAATAGDVYFLSETTPGALTLTEPSGANEVSKPLVIAINATDGQFFNFRGKVILPADANITSGGTSTDNAIVRWDGVTGLVVQDSAVIIDDSDNITGINDLEVNGVLTLPALIPGSVLFTGVGGAVTEDNTNFFYNDAVNRLQLGGTPSFGGAQLSLVDTAVAGMGIEATVAGGQSFIELRTQEGIIATFNASQGTNAFLGTQTAHDFFIETNNASRIYIDSLGHIMLGGAVAANSTVQINGSLSTKITTQTLTYTATALDHVIYANNAVTMDVNLPTAIGIDGREYIVQNINATGTAILVPFGLETINNASSLALGNQWDAAKVKSNGANWTVVAFFTNDGGLGTYTPGSVIFAGSTGDLTEDNANFFWDNTNNRLGLGTTVPAEFLHINNPTGDSGYILFTGNNVGYLKIGIDGANTQSVITYDNGDSTSLTFQEEGNDVLTMSADGYVGLNQTTPVARLQVFGRHTGTGKIAQFDGDDIGNRIYLIEDFFGNDISFIAQNPAATKTRHIIGYTDDLVIVSNGNITIDPISGFTGLNVTPTNALDINSNTIRVRSFGTAGFVKNSASGVFSTSASVSLTTDVSGVLPLANGGTNKNMTASAGSVAYSDADSFEFSAVGTTGQALISGGTGAPTWFAPTAGSVLFAGTSGILQQDNANLFYDDTANALGLGTNSINASAILQINSTTKGFLPPRMTTVQRDAIATPAQGLMIFNTTTVQWEGFDGTDWVILG